MNGSRSPRGSRSPKIKVKAAHVISELEDGKSEDGVNSSAFATKFSSTKWYRADLKFPCPLSNHQHEMSMCAEFFSLSPGDRWNKMEKGRICYSCI